MPDITSIAHERDSDGNLLPVEETVTVNDEEFEVEVYPATSGLQSEWLRKLSDEGRAEVSDELTYELIDDFYNPDDERDALYEPADFGVDGWADVRPTIVEALSSVAMSKVYDADDADKFVAELKNASAEAAGN